MVNMQELIESMKINREKREQDEKMLLGRLREDGILSFSTSEFVDLMIINPKLVEIMLLRDIALSLDEIRQIEF